MTIFRRLVPLAVAAFGIAVSSLAFGESPSLEIISLRLTEFPRPQVEKFWVVRTQEDWKGLRERLGPNLDSNRNLDGVDLKKYIVLIVALGTRPSSGYSVMIQSARDDGAAIHVSVLEVRPGAQCPVMTELTFPATAVLIPRTDKPVRFEIRSADLDCRSLRNALGS
jgi:hypothetical protein